MPRRLLATLLVWISLLSAAHAAHEIVNRTYDPKKTNSKIRITALVGKVPPSGYMPIRVHLRNNTKVSRSWSLNFTSTDTSYNDSGNEMRSDYDLPCEAKQSMVYDLLVPLTTSFMNDYGSSTTELRVSASAPGFFSVGDSMSSEYTPEWPSIMISESLANRNGSLLTTAARDKLSRGSHGGMASSIEFGGNFDPKEMSSDWRAYSGFDHCLLSENDWSELNPEEKSALLRWNRLGGGLLIYTTSASTDLATLGIPDIERGPRSVQRSWGVVKVQDLPSNLQMDATTTVAQLATELPATMGSNRLKMLREDFSNRWPLQLQFGSKTAHVLFFILVLIAFGILVGPINLFVFAKSGQRHRLFITTPIISLGASLILVVLILLQDGFGGRGQRVVLMEVRSGDSENAAYLAQEQISRTGVLLSTGFKTSEPTLLSPVLLADSRWSRVTAGNDGGSSRFTGEVQEDGLRVTGDWFKSRSEHGHYLETMRPTRGRIELRGSTGPPVITSTFEFPLEEVIYTDEKGGHWKASDVQQGTRTSMTLLDKNGFNSWKSVESAKFSERNQHRFAMTVGRRRHFVASTSEADGIDTLESMNWTKTHTVITGSVFTP